MLLIMFSVMIHNAYPHAHHQHDESDLVVGSGEFHHHGHHADHPHSDEDEQDHEKSTFLDFLFKHHSHNQHSQPFPSVTNEQVKSIKQLDLKEFGISGIWEFNVRQIFEELHRYVLYENFVIDALYFQAHPHRGPPSLG